MPFKKERWLLKSLTPIGFRNDYTTKLVTKLVPSSAGPPSGFVDSVATLLSSPHSTVVAVALSFLDSSTSKPSLKVKVNLVESDLIAKVLTAVQRHTQPITGNATIIYRLIRIIYQHLFLATPSYVQNLTITSALDKNNHREMIFQKVVIPSSQFVTFLISNRNLYCGDLFNSFMTLLRTLIRMCPFHRPTLDFVLASPIVMAFSSCLSFIEDENCLERSMDQMVSSLTEWMTYGPDMVESGKRMMQALISEGFEDTLEQMTMNNMDEQYGEDVVHFCHSISFFLGFNAKPVEQIICVLNQLHSSCVKFVIIEHADAVTVASIMARRSGLSRMTPTHFCGLSSDVGNALIAGADEQILGSPPIAKKWLALLGWSFSTRLSLNVISSTVLSPNNSCRPSTMHCDQIIFPNLDF
ncbi:hypothetical protein BLNAU_5030 [Blattamonas nauphoetae]|uniref:Uncharacterized protein n=1 Tax=Blattamonas nauphoetae TaxID=2049346 RepID=A0ABQ9Y8Q7_9EUKA|nr:hypothetical protein BLNAU_5030 [Blattamonas nauphoetae]